MKEQLKMISSFFDELCNNFEDIYLACYYDDFLKTFIVKVSPTLFHERNVNYITREYDFTNKFELTFVGYEIMFVSEDDKSYFNGKEVLIERISTNEEY